MVRRGDGAHMEYCLVALCDESRTLKSVAEAFKKVCNRVAFWYTAIAILESNWPGTWGR